MSYKDYTYVVFDGDNDKWAYSFMKGWNAQEHMDFNFHNAHDLDNMTSRAQGEAYVKSKLKERMQQAAVVVVLIGESTKNLFKFVRWEIELAHELGKPVIAVNLNEKRQQDPDRVPAIVRDNCAVHVAFKMKIIKHALDNWPDDLRSIKARGESCTDRYYNDDTYRSLGL